MPLPAENEQRIEHSAAIFQIGSSRDDLLFPLDIQTKPRRGEGSSIAVADLRMFSGRV